MGIFEKVFGTHSEKEIKRIQPLVDKVLALDESMQALSDDELRAKTDEFKKRLSDGETLDDLLVEAFAVVREAAVRTLGMKHIRYRSWVVFYFIRVEFRRCVPVKVRR